MENSVFLGVRMPDVVYNRVCFQDIPLDCSLTQSGLIKKAADRFNLQSSDFAFVFCGRTLNDDCNLREQGVRSGVTIHVMKKPRTKSESKHAAVELPLTEEKMKQVTAVYKRLWGVTHPRVISRIVKEYPEIREDLGALAILRDPILLSSMKSAENLQEIAKRYSVFIQAAPAIGDILHKLVPVKVKVQEFEDSESSSSSSSEDLTANTPGPSSSYGSALNNNNNNHTNNNVTSSRHITQAELAEALAFVGAAFRSAQAATATVAESSRDREPMDLAATVEPLAAGATAPATIERRSENAINESMLNSALNNIQSTEGASSTAAPPDLRTRYSQELLHMQEMGLTDEQVNLQALQICNGDLESAINLVFSSS